MDFNFVMFHSRVVLVDSNLKDFTKVFYSYLINSLSLRVFAIDSDFFNELGAMFGVSGRSVRRAFNQLKEYGYIHLYKDKNIYIINDLRGV